jgi:hypothetical protein
MPSISPYVGADAQLQLVKPKIQTEVVKQSQFLPAANIYGGVKFNQYFSGEVGTLLQKPKRLAGNAFKTSGFHVTAIGTYPLDTNLNLIGGAGLSRLKYTYSQPAGKTVVSKTVPRFLGGVEYTIFTNTKVRGIFTYQHTSNINVHGIQPNDSCFGSVGLNYSF